MPPKRSASEAPPPFNPGTVPERSASEIRQTVLQLLNVEVEELVHARRARALLDEESERLDRYGRLVAQLERAGVKSDDGKSDEEILRDVLGKLPTEVLLDELKRRRS
jgi:hypothetical protein